MYRQATSGLFKGMNARVTLVGSVHNSVSPL
jgi:hypothetical protein